MSAYMDMDNNYSHARYGHRALYSYVIWNPVFGIERLRLMSQAVKHPQHSPLYSVSLIRLQGKKVVSSTVILETQAA